MSKSVSSRVLAIAPGARHLGLAVLEGDELVWFGVKPFGGRKTVRELLARAERCLERVVAVYRPSVLAIEEPFYAQARLSPLVRSLAAWAKRWGRKRGFRIATYLPTTVKDQLAPAKKTRQALADAMVRRYWFLYHRAKPGRTRHYWQQMFDAVALGVAAAADTEN